MNETVPQDSPSSPEQRRGGSVDLDHVNPLQLAVLERARAAEERRRWLPGISTPQWIVSALIAIALVLGIFKVVDGGLTAFQKFAEVYSQSSPPAEVPAVAPEIDLTQPVPIILVPDTAGDVPESSSTPE